MAAFIVYILRWAVCLTLLYSLFGLFMKRETLHGVNRIVLLVVLAASMVLPMVQVEAKKGNMVAESCEKFEQRFSEWQTLFLSSREGELLADDMPEATPRPSGVGVGLAAILVLVYLSGVVIAWLRYFWSLCSLLLLIRQGKRAKVDGMPKGVKVLTHPAIKTPCSWMHWMLLAEGDTQSRPIVMHELAHIRLRHSWDMLLCELTCRMLWCVPFAWMLRQDLRDIHEYQADRRVLSGGGIDENEYQLLLIRKATSTGLQPVVNALNQSPIRRRFKMMYRKPSRRWVALKAAYLLPLCALAVVAFARPQTMSEIEEKVEAATPAVVDVIKTVAQQFPAPQENGSEGLDARRQGEEDMKSPTTDDGRMANVAGQQEQPDSAAVVTFDNAYLVPEDAKIFSDANLVKADLAESGHSVLSGSPAKSATELLDSTMLAVGARKIADGTYVGHFQPSLNSDTVRIAHATILDRQSQKADEHRFAQNTADPYAYDVTLNAETRRGRTGYYIRFLQPVSSTLRNFDKKEVDPKLLSTDSVLTKRSNNLLSYYFTPIAIERDKKETRVYMYAPFHMPPEEEVRLREQNVNIYKNLAIVDEMTGDKYVCRSMDWSYFKYVKDETVGKDSLRFYQMCLVFPPIGKRVKEAHFGHVDRQDRSYPSFAMNEIPRKGRVITN